MTISFCTDRSGADVVFELTDLQLHKLEQGFDQFEKKTGIFIDPYATTKLHNSHLKLLCEMLSCSQAEFAPELIKKFEAISQEAEVLYLVGE